jgi:hypothetical protein
MFIGTIVDPWVLNQMALRVFPEDDSIGLYTEPVFIPGQIKD